MIALFPGQGSQKVGMGKALFENFKEAREVFEEGSDACAKNFKKLCFDGPDSDLTLTENLQPALLITSVAAFRAAQAVAEVKPTIVAGHSLGEYSALVAAGAFRLWDAARLVQKRGQAMQSAVPADEGKMAALLGMEDADIEKLCKEAAEFTGQIVEIANFNAPGQTVISGSKEAVEKAITLAKEKKSKAIELNVSAPFHCSLMKPARETMAKALQGFEPALLNCSYIPNRTARISNEKGIILELLIEQIDHAVLWKQSMATALAAGHTRFIEFGSGGVLQGLLKRIAKDAGSNEIQITGIQDVESLKAVESDITRWRT